jgi:hypothetical protein
MIMNVIEVLDEIKKLSPSEKQQVINALLESEDDQPKSDDEKRAELYRRLLAEGIIKSLPTRQGRPPELSDFKPITVEGKPVSETIIEERR